MGLTQPQHYGAALVTAAAAVVLCVAARRWPGRWTEIVARVLAVALVLNLVVWQVVVVHGGTWRASGDLMVDLCPVANVVTAAALWTRRPLLVELAYFWACAGCIQGILQPDARWNYPDYFYFQFYIDHAGVLVAALYLVVGLGCRPRPGAVWRVFGITVAFAGVAAIADVLSDGNYMYLRDKGPAGTLLDLMGPWPWYIASASLFALGLLLLLDVPWRVERGRDRPRAGARGRSPGHGIRGTGSAA